MGEGTSKLNGTLNGHHGHAVQEHPEHNDSTQHSDNYADDRELYELRGEIEETRSELSGTIDALQAKLNPQTIKDRVTHDVREAATERARQFTETAKAKVHQLEEAATPVIESAREKVTQVSQQVVHKVRGDEPSDAAGVQNTSPLKPIREQVVVVFGASSGIGRETAIQFARKGAKVVVAARNQEGLHSLVESIRNFGGDASYQVADVADFDQVKAVADHAAQTYGRIDTWVHCAAVSLYAKFEETTPEEFKRLIEVNLVGQAYGAMAALPYLKREGRGALIHISSVEGKRALPLQSAYASSKHGIIGFLDALRIELMEEGVPIFVTNVMPAGINTPFFNKARTKMGVKPMPMPPIYQPEIVAEVILHAAEHPTRDIFAGGAARMMASMNNFSATVMDKMLQKTGFKGQQTNEIKSQDAPDNLYHSLDGYSKIGGDFADKAKPKSMLQWFETNPNAARIAKGVAIASVALLLLRRK